MKADEAVAPQHTNEHQAGGSITGEDTDVMADLAELLTFGRDRMSVARPLQRPGVLAARRMGNPSGLFPPLAAKAAIQRSRKRIAYVRCWRGGLSGKSVGMAEPFGICTRAESLLNRVAGHLDTYKICTSSLASSDLARPAIAFTCCTWLS